MGLLSKIKFGKNGERVGTAVTSVMKSTTNHSADFPVKKPKESLAKVSKSKKNKDANGMIRAINNSQVTLLVVPSETYNNSLLNFIKRIDKNTNGYISINKGYSALVESFLKYKIQLSNFFFIDCVTKTITEPKRENNCVYVSSPNALTELALAITKIIKADFDNVVLDSLSTLLVYHPSKDVTRFIHSVSNKIRENTNINFILTIASKDKHSDLFKQVQMLVDETIEL